MAPPVMIGLFLGVVTALAAWNPACLVTPELTKPAKVRIMAFLSEMGSVVSVAKSMQWRIRVQTVVRGSSGFQVVKSLARLATRSSSVIVPYSVFRWVRSVSGAKSAYLKVRSSNSS
ncbi:hypothetical protein IV203_015678 [Nitzschia inconspicua]|uniref:Secreted protein n=1 Tax=Nitzschia inconspicua TaxID=303405 RepID=A0A9K3LB95_9STRA|nr:hypothetical protein IV203_015678 [Nitzschia inconspicua]